GPFCDPNVVTFWGALGSTLNVQEYASHAAFGRRLASGPFSTACGTRRLTYGDRDAGGGSGHAVDDADGVGDEAADGVKRLALDNGNEVVGAGDGVHRRHAGAWALDLREGLLDLLGLAGRGFDEHVGFHGFPPCGCFLESRNATATAPMPAATGQKLVRKKGMAKNGE